MHIKRRRDRLMLYRSRWIAKGTDGNTHGYSAQEYVASLHVGATDVSPELREKLTEAELAWLGAACLEPARKAAVSRQHLEAERQTDPRWRVAEALRLLREGAEFSKNRPVPTSELSLVESAIASFSRLGGVRAPVVDPLETLNAALANATRAIKDGVYGVAPETGVRDSRVYRAWQQFQGLLSSEQGYLRTLQRQGWVKAKGR